MRLNHIFEVKSERETLALKRACADCRVSYNNKGDGCVLVFCEPHEVESVRERWTQILNTL
jgi:hypothetical protein